MTDNSRRLRHASVFSGIGGPEIAAAMLGWENVFHCEINPFGRRVLEYWFPKSESYEDITKTDFRRYRGQVDVLSGGFPCQPFSMAGKRKGARDDRYLWPEMLRVIDEVRPSWVIGENVAGITSMVEPGEVVEMGREISLFGEDDGVHRYCSRGGFTVERVCSDLEGSGYSVQPVLIPACAVGAPHRRDRVFFIAHSNGDGGQEETERELRNVKKDDEQSEPLFSSIASHSDSIRLSRRAGKDYGEKNQKTVRTSVFGQVERFGKEWNAPNSYSERLQVFNISQWDEMGKREIEERYSKQHPSNVRRTLFAEQWQNFPTQSPVCRRDDGLPFDVDDLAIPYTRWRQESIKAYGNAIVPQVTYEIFKAIEKEMYNV